MKTSQQANRSQKGDIFAHKTSSGFSFIPTFSVQLVVEVVVEVGGKREEEAVRRRSYQYETIN